MTRYPIALFLLATVVGLSACTTSEDEVADAKKPAVAATAVLHAPATPDDKLWKPYLQQVVAQHMDGVTDRVFPYYLPMNSRVVDPKATDGRTAFDRQAEGVTAAISRTVLPGNMLVFGSPDSATMADLITSSFSGAKPDALKGSQVLFVGTAADSARVQPLVEAAGGKYIFVEAK